MTIWGYKLYMMDPDDKYREILSSVYKNIYTWMKLMMEPHKLPLSDIITLMLDALEFQPPPQLHKDDLPNAQDWIDYMDAVHKEMHQPTNLASMFQDAEEKRRGSSRSSS